MRSRKMTWTMACILGVLLCAGHVVEAAPVNDNCSNAMLIEEVADLAFNTSTASFDGPGHCMTSANIWYVYTATVTGEVTISLCGSAYDTKLAVYSGSACNPTYSRLLNCNDDACGWQSEVTINATAGSSYLIEVGGYGSNKGQGVLNFIYEPQQAYNDNCANALEIGEVTNLAFDTTDATFDGPGLCIQSPCANIWYVYTASYTGEATISLCGSSFDTVLAVYDGAACYPKQSDRLACNDDSDCGQQSQAVINVKAGNKYLIEIGGFNSQAKGPGVLTISSEAVSQDQFELGDAPDSSNSSSVSMLTYPTSVQAHFPTVFEDGSGIGPYGPIHLDPGGLAFLGERVSRESEADTGWDQDTVNNIVPLLQQSNQDQADDGVVFPINMPHCQWTTFDYLVYVVNANTDIYVNVWCDWNRDGDWNDDSTTNPTMSSAKGNIDEWVVQNQLLFNLPSGLHELTTPAFLPWHPQAGPKNIWMRITLSEQPWKGGSGAGGSGPQAGYQFGETEDYYFVPETTCAICEDTNGDGVINMNDLVTYVNQWLANCQ